MSNFNKVTITVTCIEVHVKMYTTAFLMIIHVGMKREKLISGKIFGVSLN